MSRTLWRPKTTGHGGFSCSHSVSAVKHSAHCQHSHIRPAWACALTRQQCTGVRGTHDLAHNRLYDSPLPPKHGKASTQSTVGNAVSHFCRPCRLEAITLTDMEDLLAPAVYGDDDILGLLAGGSLSDALASQGAVPVDRRRLAGGAEVGLGSLRPQGVCQTIFGERLGASQGRRYACSSCEPLWVAAPSHRPVALQSRVCARLP